MDVASHLPQRTLELRSLADVRPSQTTWLSEGRVPFGALTVIAGRPGEGKSQLTIALAARLSHDSPAVLIGAEDDEAHTIVPRLIAQGANRENVLTPKVSNEWGRPDAPSFPVDVERLGRQVKESGAMLVVVDPFAAHLDPDLNAFNDHSLRQATRPLAAMARETGAAVVIVSHLRKSREGGAMDWIGGSGGLVGSARSVFIFGRSKKDDAWDEDRRYLLNVKNNLAKLAAPMRFRVETRLVDFGGRMIETSRVVSEEEDRSVKVEDIE